MNTYNMFFMEKYGKLSLNLFADIFISSAIPQKNLWICDIVPNLMLTSNFDLHIISFLKISTISLDIVFTCIHFPNMV